MDNSKKTTKFSHIILMAVGVLIMVVLVSVVFTANKNITTSEQETTEINNNLADGNMGILAVISDEYVGKYFVHSESDMTLYVLTAGACSNGCLSTWKPYIADEALTDGDLDVIVRDDTGELQYTWMGKELYTFINDEDSGYFLGDGYDGVWTIARP